MRVLLALIFCCLLATGCVMTELRVKNQTGAGIYLYSGHTKKVTSIPSGHVASVPHSSGRIIVLTTRDEIWEYDDVASVVDEATHSDFKVSLPVRIEPDGSIVLPGGKKLTPTRKLAG